MTTSRPTASTATGRAGPVDDDRDDGDDSGKDDDTDDTTVIGA